MSDQFKEILDIPRDFLHDGTQFMNRCTKPDKRELLKISQAVGVGFVVMGALGYIVKLRPSKVGRSIIDADPRAILSLLTSYLFLDEERQAEILPLTATPKNLILAILILYYRSISMQPPLTLLFSLVFLVFTRGLPTPSASSMAPFGAFPLAYNRRDLNRQSLATGYSTVGRSQIWGGTPANTSICRSPALWTGKWWWIMGSIAFLLVALYGLLAFVMWGILSVDLPRLTVWNRTGDKRRRIFAGKVLKVRNRPDWLLLSLVAVSVAIAEVLPLFWNHLFAGGSVPSYVATNLVILVSQVGPTFVMPVFHLEISGRFTWFVRLIMWFSAPVTVAPAYALRRFRKWRKRGQQTRMDGLMPLDELIEYIHLHEKGQGWGGTLDNHVGKAIRTLMEEQVSSEASSIQGETEGSWSIQTSESVASTSVQSFHLEGSTAIDAESAVGPTGIRSHRQEGSTAIENVPAAGLRKRGERSTEGHEPVVPIMRVPQQALIKDLIRGSPTLVNDRCVEDNTLIAKVPRWDFPVQNLSNSAPPRRHRLLTL